MSFANIHDSIISRFYGSGVPFFIFRLQILAVRRPSARSFLLPAE